MGLGMEMHVCATWYFILAFCWELQRALYDLIDEKRRFRDVDGSRVMQNRKRRNLFKVKGRVADYQYERRPMCGCK